MEIGIWHSLLKNRESSFQRFPVSTWKPVRIIKIYIFERGGGVLVSINRRVSKFGDASMVCVDGASRSGCVLCSAGFEVVDDGEIEGG